MCAAGTHGAARGARDLGKRSLRARVTGRRRIGAERTTARLRRAAVQVRRAAARATGRRRIGAERTTARLRRAAVQVRRAAARAMERRGEV
ncbi:hypothetical protein Afil01_04910 [Actinorhabdospora filicis]|uniref:Uncharacterized protein n=1 Tax=Actinorhabdospora filicis TaxID=1785913 RepID=A0A9W6SHR3_9ACTN|nr:hypothetical protein Afil01_04910 [Actinorhabdospora filicis]